MAMNFTTTTQTMLHDTSVPKQQQEQHALRYTWVFWFMHRTRGAKITNYEEGMKRIAAFSTASIHRLLLKSEVAMYRVS